MNSDKVKRPHERRPISIALIVLKVGLMMAAAGCLLCAAYQSFHQEPGWPFGIAGLVCFGLSSLLGRD